MRQKRNGRSHHLVRIPVATRHATTSVEALFPCGKALSPRERDGIAAPLACCCSGIRPGSGGGSTGSTVSSSGGRAGTQDCAEGQAPPRRSRGSRSLRGASTRGGPRCAFRSASGGQSAGTSARALSGAGPLLPEQKSARRSGRARLVLYTHRTAPHPPDQCLYGHL